jgi:hypothetical protein
VHPANDSDAITPTGAPGGDVLIRGEVLLPETGSAGAPGEPGQAEHEAMREFEPEPMLPEVFGQSGGVEAPGEHSTPPSQSVGMYRFMESDAIASRAEEPPIVPDGLEPEPAAPAPASDAINAVAGATEFTAGAASAPVEDAPPVEPAPEIESVAAPEQSPFPEPEPAPAMEAPTSSEPEPVPARPMEPEPVAASEPEAPPPAPEAEPELVVTETMAEIFLRQGHRELALAVYAQLVQRDPANERVGQAYARLSETLAPPPAAAPAPVAEPEPVKPRYDADSTGGRSVAQLFGLLLSAPRPAVSATVHPPAFESRRRPLGEPTRPSGETLSLSAVFGEEGGAAGPAGTSAPAGEPSFDEFFAAEGAPADEARLPRAQTEAPVGPAPEDLEQFNAWLRGLKR